MLPTREHPDCLDVKAKNVAAPSNLRSGQYIAFHEPTLPQLLKRAFQSMARYAFSTDRKYAGRLIGVTPRPIENDPLLGIHLLRLEFEIFWQFLGDRPTLKSEGEIACRDLVIGKSIPPSKDSGQLIFASALRVDGDLTIPDSWIARVSSNAWIEITFGEREIVGGRNPFQRISWFDVSRWNVERYRFDRTKEWVTIAVAADAVQASESTARRFVDSLELQFGARLVRRTDGGQRRIHLPLFVNLWSESH